MTQQQQILNYLGNGNWRCMANPDFFMKDDRKIISVLKRKGFDIQSRPCDGRCGVNHKSRLLMRRLNGA